MYLFYDIETTGVNHKKDKIIQIAYALYDLNFETVCEKNIVLNDGNHDRDYFKLIPIEDIKNGIHPRDIMPEIYKDFIKSKYVISYSGSCFDERFMNLYFSRYNLEPLIFNNRIDLMKICCNYLKSSKLVKLTESYLRIMGKPHNNTAHTATSDVIIMIEIFNKLISTNVITL